MSACCRQVTAAPESLRRSSRLSSVHPAPAAAARGGGVVAGQILFGCLCQRSRRNGRCGRRDRCGERCRCFTDTAWLSGAAAVTADGERLKMD